TVDVGNPSGRSCSIDNLVVHEGLAEYLYGKVSVKNIQLMGGKVWIGVHKPLRVETLAISGAAKLDVTKNGLVVAGDNVGSWDGAAYTGVTGLIQSGRNGGNWAGSGIVTSQTLATSGNFTSIGVATAAQAKGIATAATAVWSGQTVTGSDTLVMYTYGGDANLDGKI